MSKTNELSNLPWITPEGWLDPTKLPIDSTLRQCVSGGRRELHNGCSVLAMMVGHGRVEAGVFLLGLLRYYEDDLAALTAIVESLGGFHDRRCVSALVGELRRVVSSNTTRRYLDSVIRTLARLPAAMVSEPLWALAQDATFSYKIRAKFQAAAESLDRDY